MANRSHAHSGENSRLLVPEEMPKRWPARQMVHCSLPLKAHHRIWRYDAPPGTFTSTPTPIAVPSELARAPRNGGIEGLTSLPDGRLLALTEEFANPDGSFKGWLLDGDRFAELSYLPAKGFRVTDSAALKNGDVLVLERRYVPFGILSARVTMIDAKKIQPGAKLSGQELLKIEQPLVTENFEGLAVQETAKGTMIYLVSDDNYNPFQQTLLLQFSANRPASLTAPRRPD